MPNFDTKELILPVSVSLLSQDLKDQLIGHLGHVGKALG